MSQMSKKVRRHIRSAYQLPHLCECCREEMELEKQAPKDRPGHVFRVEDGKIFYMEDAVAEGILGRPLQSDEMVIHKNDDPLDNRSCNLEVVKIPVM